MIFNVVICFILGNFIERKLGHFKFALIYLLGGTLGIIASIEFYPNYVSSGSSQALMSLCACIITLRYLKYSSVRFITILAYITTITQLGLDIYVSSYPKAGHMFGFLVGFILVYFFFFKTEFDSNQQLT